MNRRYLVAVALLAILAVVFGLAGTVAPPLAGEVKPSTSSASSSSSVAHFQNPPTYDSGWVNITDKCGRYFSLEHNLNTTEVVVDITGKQGLDPMGGTLAWGKTYGGTNYDYARSVVQTSDGGYAVAGYTNSFGALGYDFWLVKTDSAGNTLWNGTYGGPGNDYAISAVQTADGGYALAGYTYSFGVGTPTYSNVWLVKTDPRGNELWSQTYGGAAGDDYAFSLVQRVDGGYTIAGYTGSYGAGGYDMLLVKTDPDGNELWDITYGGTGNDYALSLVQVQIGYQGYAFAGFTYSYGDVNGDFFLVRTDLDGNELWDKTYGGPGIDYAFSLVQTSDGGYALLGWHNLYGSGYPNDFLLVKTDSDGNKLWSQTYGGAAGDDYAYSIVQTIDGGYALGGETMSFGVGGDFWLIKTDSYGNALWNRTYGGATADRAYSLVQTSDGGYALAGYTSSYGAGGADFWLIKVKPELYLEHQWHLGATDINVGWSRTFGGPNEDRPYSLVQTVDGGYAVAGETKSFGAGGDFWLIKTDASGTMQWSKTFGGPNEDIAYSLIQTADGGYALGGETMSFGVGGDFWLIKTDALGNMQWSKTYGGANTEVAYSVVQTGDGGYALGGYTYSFGVGTPTFRNVWLVKTDPRGNELWSRTYGGIYDDYAHSLVQTVDGGYALTGSYGVADSSDFWLVKTNSAGNALWNKTYARPFSDFAESVIQTGDGGYALAGFTETSYKSWVYDMWLVKTDSAGFAQWNKTYGGPESDDAHSVVQTADGGYVLAGHYTDPSRVPHQADSWLVKTDALGNMQWSKTYGGAGDEFTRCVTPTADGGYALAVFTDSYGAGGGDFWLVKSDVEMGLARTGLTNTTITIYRGKTDIYWNYVRVRIWIIQEPSWIYGDINLDGVVDIKDLYIVSRNYGKTFSLLSLSGIAFIAGIQTYKSRKKQHN